MTFDSRHRNTVYSLVIFAFLSGLVYIIPWDSDFAGFGLLLVTETVAIFVGGLLLILNLTKIWHHNEGLIYNYFGMLNLLIGVILLTIGLTNMYFARPPAIVLVNLLLGGLIMYDIYRSKAIL